jgi:hypothetical protein
MAKVDSMDGKAQTRFHNESRVGETRVHARRLAKANQLIWWINLLFEKVESMSGTNKTRSKILKLKHESNQQQGSTTMDTNSTKYVK